MAETATVEGAAYGLARLDGRLVAAISGQPRWQLHANLPPLAHCYVTVGSADDAAAEAERLGGTIQAPPSDARNARMAIVEDPQDTILMLWESQGNAGAELVDAVGALAWNELRTTDPQAAAAFYGGLFGWEIDSELTIHRDGRAIGRARALPPGEPRSHWLPCFGVEDVEVAMRKATELGGRPVQGGDVVPVEMPGGGVIGLRAGFSAWRLTRFRYRRSHGRAHEHVPGTFSWTDLTTTDQEGAKAFYGGLLGWDFEDNPVGDGMVYSMARVGGKNVGAISTQPQQQRDAGVPPMWNSYVTVESADATAQRAGDLGATVHAPPFDVMDVGRMAVIADPQGAFFEIWEPRASIGAELVNVPGAMVWNELATTDLDAGAAFYRDLFGWETPEFEGSPQRYLSIKNGGRSNGGMRDVSRRARRRTGSSTSAWRTSTQRSRRSRSSVA